MYMTFFFVFALFPFLILLKLFVIIKFFIVHI